MYQIEFLKEAVNDLKRIDKIWQKRITGKIKLLAEDPQILENNIKKLKGEKGAYFRLRVGDYRVILDIIDDKLIIHVIELGHRKNIYKK